MVCPKLLYHFEEKVRDTLTKAVYLVWDTSARIFFQFKAQNLIFLMGSLIIYTNQQ